MPIAGPSRFRRHPAATAATATPAITVRNRNPTATDSQHASVIKPFYMALAPNHTREGAMRDVANGAGRLSEASPLSLPFNQPGWALGCFADLAVTRPACRRA